MRGELEPSYITWYGKRSQTHLEPERPAKRPHVQLFTDGAQGQWDWLGKEANYRAIISKLEGQIRDLKFDRSVQAAADEGEKKKLAQENQALRAQIQKIKIAVENQERSQKDERLIRGLKRKIVEYEDDLKKSEGNLAKARAQLAKNTEGRAAFIQKMKERYEKGVTGWEKEISNLESKMDKQAKSFKVEREHCYALMAQLEGDLQHLQE
ncbi:uncharacterized protein [Nicotiana sylvestris]|uniref:uncharacterized protein n=1 Tax=Nicotiana sylvestris TaxID=4096 RepID=UPI00388CD03F